MPHQLKWSEPDEEKLVEYMCGEKGFSEERIRNGVKKLMKARSSSTQGRLDSFFKVLPSPKTNGTNNNKRKVSRDDDGDMGDKMKVRSKTHGDYKEDDKDKRKASRDMTVMMMMMRVRGGR